MKVDRLWWNFENESRQVFLWFWKWKSTSVFGSVFFIVGIRSSFFFKLFLDGIHSRLGVYCRILRWSYSDIFIIFQTEIIFSHKNVNDRIYLAIYSSIFQRKLTGANDIFQNVGERRVGIICMSIDCIPTTMQPSSNTCDSRHGICSIT